MSPDGNSILVVGKNKKGMLMDPVTGKVGLFMFV